jgi:UDP-2,4-diacetamido-2,4,6-trideoxy-beta-L-altropyranose hydrolase
MKAAFRVDSSVSIGTGHVMRCLVLANALKRSGAQALFVARDLPGHIGAQAVAAGHELALLPAAGEDAGQTLAALRARGAWDWLVVDHYGLDEAWEHQLRRVARRVFVVDDLADRRHDCDLLLDAGTYASPGQRYAGLVPDGSVTLLGPKYALLRPEFVEARFRARPRDGRVARLLVSFGGTDPTRQTASALEGIRLAEPRPAAIDVVVGSSNPDAAGIARLCAQLPGAKLHVQPSNMGELMEAADLCIGAGGLAAWERCAIGLPSVVTMVAGNQRAALQYLAERGCVWLAGNLAALPPDAYADALGRATRDPDAVRQMGANARALMDGCERGVAECVEHMRRGVVHA